VIVRTSPAWARRSTPAVSLRNSRDGTSGMRQVQLLRSNDGISRPGVTELRVRRSMIAGLTATYRATEPRIDEEDGPQQPGYKHHRSPLHGSVTVDRTKVARDGRCDHRSHGCHARVGEVPVAATAATFSEPSGPPHANGLGVGRVCDVQMMPSDDVFTWPRAATATTTRAAAADP
jgi:hypothetical protein